MSSKRGIYNLELIDTRALVRNKAFEFLFVLGQPLYKGATRSISTRWPFTDCEPLHVSRPRTAQSNVSAP